MSTEIVSVNSLTKIYPGGVKGADGVSFSVRKGEVFGLIGPNGAGKTTILRIIATILQPSSGSVTIAGYDVVKEPDMVRRIISYLPEDAGAYKYLTGLEFLRFIGKLYGYRESDVEKMVRDGVQISGLGERLNDKIKSYSKGMLRRLLVAKTLMVNPMLTILDEPTSGLDVINAIRIRNIIRNYAKERGVTVLVSSHNMLEVEHLCDRVGIIYRGKMLAVGEPKTLKELYAAQNLEEVFIRLIGGKSQQ
ncbi:MAG: ABC transporter ATP-binding protein [Ignisphaera sp.]|nr:ABC transporter ATP-binding protein [Ignisphaera sp.]MCX8167482.1 ABC transporter ATP-binding protein [Ignisphaera sp.]MDW8084654.1 ABC transporter ATP-binding protein [Ignisphaera sp.]